MASFDQVVNAKAVEIGKLAVRATTAAGSGHPTTSLSLAHIVTVLMYHVMRWDPERPAFGGSDRLVLSEGHAVPIVYAACADLGVTFYPLTRPGEEKNPKRMTVDDLMTLRDVHSPIDGHPNPVLGFPFFDAATGSLGQGLSVAAGLGAAARVDRIDKKIYCIIGDGESREGQIWEAMDFIADQKLTNVIAIFNSNELGQSDWVAPAQTGDELVRKAEAFGWKVLNVDGHNPSELLAALKQRSEAVVSGKPLCIVARTVKGWGAPTLHGMGHHGQPVPEKDLEKVLKELDAAAAELQVKGISEEEVKRVLKIPAPPAPPEHRESGKVATLSEMAEKHKMAEALHVKKKMSARRGFGLALEALGAANPNVISLDADVKNSTYSEYFAKHYPSHYFECRIAEQNMVSAAAGLSAAGKIPFVSTFGKFLSRAFDQVEMAIISGANIKFVGTHIGVTLAADGPSQMAVADLPFMRGIAHVKDHRGNPAITVLTPCDVVSAYTLVLKMALWPSAAYLRALRADTPVIYKEGDAFPFGKFKVVQAGRGLGGKKITIVTCGYLVHTLMKAKGELEAAGLDATIVDAYCLPFEVEELFSIAEGGPILTVEDNYAGGLNAEVAQAAAKRGGVKVDSMFVHNLPKSGKTPEDVLAYVHLSAGEIVERAKALAG